MAKIRPSRQLTLHDKLSRLSPVQAKELLGESAAALMPKAGREEIDIATQVIFTADQFQVVFPVPQVVVNLALHPSYRDRLQIVCSHEGETGDCFRAAAVSLIFEEKLTLGLSAEPDANTPWEHLKESELEDRATTERVKRAADEKMRIKAGDKTTPCTDFSVMSAQSGKSYRVALRGMRRGEAYCSCPDFRKNRLGVCKHIIKVLESVKKRFSAADLAKTAKTERIGIFARYDGDLRLGIEMPPQLKEAVKTVVEPWRGKFANTDAEMAALFEVVRHLTQMDADFVIYPDAEEILNQAVHRHRMTELVADIRKSPAQHPLRKSLLHTELLEQLIGEPERKIIIFSEWTAMLNLIEPILKKNKAAFVRLDGQVPQKQRNMLVQRFQTGPACRCFLTTNAGSTGLNLQAADTVINIDLPWNPALLEQRIARAHRMGQKRKVQVYLMVTEGTIEENLLATLSAKHELAAAVLDPDSDLSEI